MNILIIGKNSYIGNHIDKWLSQRKWKVSQLDAMNDRWKTYDYSQYDTIVHVAGIVHQPKCKDWELYKKVNTEMPIAIAKMAKRQGVKQFIFFSTMGVYGIGKQLKPNIIDEKSPLLANSMYSKSKLLAEKSLSELQDYSFNVACIRPPSVYGKGCKGGYISGFTSIVQYLPIIPKAYENVKQSFIYIDNLSELVRLIINNNLHGYFCPQDDKPISSNELLEMIAKARGKAYRPSNILGFFMHFFHYIPIVNKVYGGIEYSMNLSSINGINYVVVPINEGIQRTVTKI